MNALLSFRPRSKRCPTCRAQTSTIYSLGGKKFCTMCDPRQPKPSCGVDGCSCGDILNHKREVSAEEEVYRRDPHLEPSAKKRADKIAELNLRLAKLNGSGK